MATALSWEDYAIPADLPPVVINDPALPLISVVTPSFNQGKFIRETIESVLTQDYPNLEYWVIDGGSTDETVAILKEFESDARFHWLSEQDKGQADAVNKGWRRCRGELLGWLNSDDTYLPATLKSLAAPFLADPELEIVYGDANRTTDTGALISVMYGHAYDLEFLLRSNFFIQPSILQRRSLVERHGPVRIELYYMLDYDFYLRASLDAKVLYLPRVCATYRIHPVSKTSTGNSKFFVEMTQVIQDFLELPGVPPKVKAKKRRILSDQHLMVAMEFFRERNGKMARRNVIQALTYSPIRPRLLLVTLVALDQTFHTSLYSGFVALWLKLKAKAKADNFAN